MRSGSNWFYTYSECSLYTSLAAPRDRCYRAAGWRMLMMDERDGEDTRHMWKKQSVPHRAHIWLSLLKWLWNKCRSNGSHTLCVLPDFIACNIIGNCAFEYHSRIFQEAPLYVQVPCYFSEVLPSAPLRLYIMRVLLPTSYLSPNQSQY